MPDTFLGRITVYTVQGCPHCRKAKKTLKSLALPYTDVRLDLFPDIRREVVKKSGMNTVPQIYFNKILIGGNEDLNKLLQDKERLDKLLFSLKTNSFSLDWPIVPEKSDIAIITSFDDLPCETDEYVYLLRDLKQNSFVGTQRVGLKFYKQAFSGKDFFKWAAGCKGLDDVAALKLGQNLLERQLIFSLSDSKLFLPTSEIYQLISEDKSEALNSGTLSNCQPKEATELGEHLRRVILQLYETFLKEDGKSVDYSGIKKSEAFQSYTRLTKELVRVNIEKVSREEKLAFFINIYNALVIHSVIIRGSPNNLWTRYKFFNDSKYIIGGCVYSLQDIENGILRANRRGVGQISKPFGKNDPRLKVALDRHEPLIHFALVCGAKSCPPIKAYTSKNIYEELYLATSAFLESDSGCQVDLAKQTLKLSSIFKWYQGDFCHHETQLVDFVLNYMQPGSSKVKDMKKIVESKNYHIDFLPYDWTSNSSHI
uniref:Uncharacterized protein n=1 Tax=Biomphalaria glabrata TaxID=6526 RepID=A0A2C9JV79_BIOGL